MRLEDLRADAVFFQRRHPLFDLLALVVSNRKDRFCDLPLIVARLRGDGSKQRLFCSFEPFGA